MANHPIFFDASGRRAFRIKVIAWVVGLTAVVIMTGFLASLLLSPPVTGLDLPGRAAAPPAPCEQPGSPRRATQCRHPSPPQPLCQTQTQTQT